MSSEFWVDGSKMPPGLKGRLQVKDAGGKVTCGPFSAGTKEGGPYYPIAAAKHYYEGWLKKGYVVPR